MNHRLQAATRAANQTPTGAGHVPLVLRSVQPSSTASESKGAAQAKGAQASGTKVDASAHGVTAAIRTVFMWNNGVYSGTHNDVRSRACMHQACLLLAMSRLGSHSLSMTTLPQCGFIR